MKKHGDVGLMLTPTPPTRKGLFLTSVLVCDRRLATPENTRDLSLSHFKKIEYRRVKGEGAKANVEKFAIETQKNRELFQKKRA